MFTVEKFKQLPDFTRVQFARENGIFVCQADTFGDSGKGRMADEEVKRNPNIGLTIRVNGGANSGHVVHHEVYGKHVFHLLGSSVFRGTPFLVGCGCALEPKSFVAEIMGAKAKAGKIGDVYIDYGTPLVLPLHRFLDAEGERTAGKNQIGTTKKGIGPCYSDFYARKGLRAIDSLLPEDEIRRKVIALYRYHGLEAVCADVDDAVEQVKMIEEYVCDGRALLEKCIGAGRDVFVEGAQGVGLDIFSGIHPNVTSSCTTPFGALISSMKVPLRNLADARCQLVVKAYLTRVGSGSAPTILPVGGADEEVRSHLARVGHEFGSTTGRPRDCGWLDLVMLKLHAKCADITEISLTKLDVLSGLAKVKVCVAYADAAPLTQTEWNNSIPVYREFDGWGDISQCKSYEDLPQAAKQYVEFIEKEVGVPIKFIGVGPNNGQGIWR